MKICLLVQCPSLPVCTHLFDKTLVGTDNAPGLLDLVQGRLQVPLVLLHQEGDCDGGRAADAHLAVDQHFAVADLGILDEVVRRVEVFELKEIKILF